VASAPTYVVDLLDVYESSSTTLGTGTAVCLDVDLEVADDCNGFETLSYNTNQDFGTLSLTDQKFSIDGTVWYSLNNSALEILEYGCSTPFDITTCTTNSSPLDLSSYDTNFGGFIFDNSGSKLFFVEIGTDQQVTEMICSTVWDVSTCTSLVDSLDISTENTNPRDIEWSNDGTKMFILGLNTPADDLDEYTCTSPFDISTCSYVDSKVTTPEATPRRHDWNYDGTEWYLIGINNIVYRFECTTAWDVSTCTQTDSLSLSGQGTSHGDVLYMDNQNQMLSYDATNTEVDIYDLNPQLKVGSTYRFEVEVDNTGAGAGSPTRLDADSVVAAGDIFGSIPVGSLLNSGCSTNTDWTEAISTTEAQFSSGTTCSLAATSGTAEFWFIVTIDPDAADGDTTFSITDDFQSLMVL
jgi:hypothetical protein